jgi:adenylosuccinate lyase
MIDRYLIKELSEIFSDESRFNAYLEIEIASLEGFSLQNKIPKDCLEKIKKNAKPLFFFAPCPLKKRESILLIYNKKEQDE